MDHHPVSQKEIYQYGSANPIKININDLSDREKIPFDRFKSFFIAHNKIFNEIFDLQKKRIYNALLNSSSEEVINFDNVLNKIING